MSQQNQPPMPPVPPQMPPMPGYQPYPPMPPARPTPWYYRMWFIVLATLFFPPAGIVLAWLSPATKITSRLMFTFFGGIWLLVLVALNSGEPTTPANTTSGSSTPAASAPAKTEPAKTPAPPKDPYDFTVTDKNSGVVYKGKQASSVGFAVIKTEKAKTVGGNFFTEKATSGATFVLVQVYIKNEQKDAVTLDGSLLKLLYEGREYSYSSQAQTALEMAEQTEMIFLKQLNPGLAVQAIVPFEVPEDINLNQAQIQFRGGMTGRTTTVPAHPVTQ